MFNHKNIKWICVSLLTILISTGCFNKKKTETVKLANLGDIIKVHYTGKLDDGSIFDSSENKDPLQFTLGQKQVIPGFEEAVIGMKLNESKTIRIPVEKAYGPHRPELIQTVDRDKLPQGIPYAIGLQLKTQQPDGTPVLLKITEVTEKTVTLDANNKLAGKDLNFEIKLVEIAS